MSLDECVTGILDAFASMNVPRKIKDEAALDYINRLKPVSNLQNHYRIYYFSARRKYDSDREYIKSQFNDSRYRGWGC